MVDREQLDQQIDLVKRYEIVLDLLEECYSAVCGAEAREWGKKVKFALDYAEKEWGWQSKWRRRDLK